jgi:hypothetical protein
VYWQGNDALVAVIRANGIVLDTDLNDALMIRWSLEPTF